MEVESLSDSDLRKLLVEHGVASSPVTDTTRNVLRNKLSKVISSKSSIYEDHTNESYTVEEVHGITTNAVSESNGLAEQMNESYTTIEEVVNTSACMVTDGDSQTSEYTKKTHTEVHPPSLHEHVHTPLVENDGSESYSSYEYTPTTTLRYARDSYPRDEDLRRRPLYTPRVRTSEPTVTKTTTHATTYELTSPPVKSTLKSWICNRVFIIILLLVICCVLLVYYHMEHDHVKSLPATSPTTPAEDEPVSNESRS